jgi:hypothetical protein
MPHSRFIVQSIEAQRHDLFYVKWVGYSAECNTWEPISSFCFGTTPQECMASQQGMYEWEWKREYDAQWLPHSPAMSSELETKWTQWCTQPCASELVSISKTMRVDFIQLRLHYDGNKSIAIRRTAKK